MSSNPTRLGYSLEFADNLSLSVGGFSDKLPELMKANPSQFFFALGILGPLFSSALSPGFIGDRQGWGGSLNHCGGDFSCWGNNDRRLEDTMVE